MKQLTITLLCLSTMLIGCRKDNSKDLKKTSIEVTLKVVDEICGNAIFEIQENSLKYLGDSNFEYKGINYNGVILITSTQCLSENFTKNIYNGTELNKTNPFKARINKTNPNIRCNKINCGGNLSKSPLSQYYIIE